MAQFDIPITLGVYTFIESGVPGIDQFAGTQKLIYFKSHYTIARRDFFVSFTLTEKMN